MAAIELFRFYVEMYSWFCQYASMNYDRDHLYGKILFTLRNIPINTDKQNTADWKQVGICYIEAERNLGHHIYIYIYIYIGSDNSLSLGRRRAIIWTNAGILLIRPLGTNFNEIVIENHTFSFKKMHLKMSTAKWRLNCLGLNMITASVLWVPSFSTLTQPCHFTR